MCSVSPLYPQGQACKSELKTELKSLDIASKKCDERRYRLIDAFSRGTLNEVDLDGQLPDIEKERAEIERQIASITGRLKSEKEISEPI